MNNSILSLSLFNYSYNIVNVLLIIPFSISEITKSPIRLSLMCLSFGAYSFQISIADREALGDIRLLFTMRLLAIVVTYQHMVCLSEIPKILPCEISKETQLSDAYPAIFEQHNDNLQLISCDR